MVSVENLAFTADAMFEALENGIKLIVVVTENVPRGEVAQAVELDVFVVPRRERARARASPGAPRRHPTGRVARSLTARPRRRATRRTARATHGRWASPCRT